MAKTAEIEFARAARQVMEWTPNLSYGQLQVRLSTYRDALSEGWNGLTRFFPDLPGLELSDEALFDRLSSEQCAGFDAALLVVGPRMS
jgi:hypothetical protein